MQWVPYSPDLNPPDFYLWGFLKGCVYQNNPKTLGELKAAIRNQIRRIPKEEIGRVIENFAKRARVCIQRGGAHLEHVLK